MTSAASFPPGRQDTLVIGGRMDADRALLTPRGELVRGCAQMLAAKLAELPAGTARVDLDMSGVHFMDTAGLGFLDVLRDHARRRSMPVTTSRWSGQPRRILELAGLDTTDPLRTPAPRSSPAGSAVALERQERLHLLQEEVEQLRQAIASRPVIDQARGVLMATYGCTSDEAWHILREASQLSNTKLRTLAESLTACAEAEGTPPPPEVRTALARALARRAPR
ncbi:ANTAR domain-containing protein [Streptomyces griseoincarnatus]|uniref:ANTAR domain-containing response regulator n=1 Tax=Streptomyces TaxID=1883 RepID=UPI0006538599|nr:MULTISPECIES: ANTAR domain-containing protein [unclassified Streptomyces]MBQ0970919.1 ANTAR domain-containing protein [Streptomyces sp. RK31]MBU5943162.1 ANTAR domain-containing protein [Streptomyces sp. PAM3C]WPW19131.1 ANTAR domain-containing protein [Streptomyces griseoincarnatus]